jgi:cell division protein ZapE
MDYRLRYLDDADIYHTPIDSMAEGILLKHFLRLAPGDIIENDSLEIHDRSIKSIRLADGVAWFEFDALCKGPRSQTDYIEIAQCFNTVLISNIPVMGQDNDVTRRFISLIDVFYDRNINLIASAAAPPSGLYTGQKLAFEFQRTQSRLTEMRTHDYLARQHCC